MLETIWLTVAEYLKFYVEFLRNQWQTLTPAKYGILLIIIGVGGWLMMKSGMKRC